MAFETIDLCLCTFRRPSVADTIASLGRMHIPDRATLRLIVADNDETPSARGLVERAAAAAALPLTYVHAPARNISIARNACLDAATAPLIAFIDDDETATADWLVTIVRHLEETGADIVFGQVRALYGGDLPKWLAAADLHSTRAVVREGTVESGYTCNVLFRHDAVRGHRFDPAYGRTGGEDDIFFSRLSAEGRTLGYCPEAVLEETVPPQRASLPWLLRRSFRNGQTFGTILLSRGAGRPAAMAKAGAKAAFCGADALTSLASAPRWRRALVRGALHVGVVSRLAGKREIEIY